MSKKKPKVFVTRRLPEQVETRMMELFDTTLNPYDKALSDSELEHVLKNHEIIVTTLTDKISDELLARCGDQVRLIANFGAGIDHIDLNAASKKNIIVTNTPGVLTEDTADMAMSLILAVPRKLSEGERLLRSGEWKGWSPTHMMGRRIWGKRLGIIGMGRIGQAIARRAKGFGISIHYNNRNKLPEAIEKNLEATYWGNLDQMIARMDIISINCPLTKDTHQLLSRNRLKLLMPHAYIVNTSRGEIVDEKAMVEFLKEKRIAGAGLDVFEREPVKESYLLKAPNTVLLPHMGSATVEGRIEMGEKVIINIKTYIDGHNPPDRVLI